MNDYLLQDSVDSIRSLPTNLKRAFLLGITIMAVLSAVALAFKAVKMAARDSPYENAANWTERIFWFCTLLFAVRILLRAIQSLSLVIQ